MSHTHHWHRSPDGTCDRQSSKHTNYCDGSPNGQSRKSSNNHNAQYSELCRSFTPDWHRSPDRTINHNVWLSPKWSIEGPSRKSSTTVDAQEICDVRIWPCTYDMINTEVLIWLIPVDPVKVQQIWMYD